MRRHILRYGAIAGLVAGSAVFASGMVFDGRPFPDYSMALGFGTMLVALSAVFVGIKRHRDVDRGGVIRFWPAFGMGVAISLIAAVCYVLAWEAAMAMMQADFADTYARTVIEKQKAKGIDGAALAKLSADMEAFKRQYADPLYRLPMTFVEIFPVGVLVSLVSAALLRNPRFMAARG